MLQYKWKKGNPRFKMFVVARSDILNDIEEQEHHII